MIDFKPKLHLYESLMFLAVQFIALFTGIRILQLLKNNIDLFRQPKIETAANVFQGSWQIIVAFAVAVVLIVVLLKFLKPTTFSAFFAFIIFVGAWAVFRPIFGIPPQGMVPPDFIINWYAYALALILSVTVVALRFWKRNLITHNFAIFVGVAGVAAILGIMLQPEVILFLLLVLSIYDFIAVFKTKHMVSMFKDMLKKGMPLAIVVPERPVALTQDVTKVSKQKLRETDKKVLMLGTGDLAFPALFAVSAFAKFGIAAALAIMIGSIIGIVFNHYLLTIKKYKVIPALPFIALFSAIGYLVVVYGPVVLKFLL